jgi:phenylacetate-CoA ligase
VAEVRVGFAIRVLNTARLAVAARRERRVPFLPRAEIEKLQRARLERTVRHAWRTVPYWRRAMEERGLVPSDIATAADLARLPLLEERDVRLRLDELRSEEWRDRETAVLESSASGRGSVPKCIPWDPDAALTRLAHAERDRAVVLRLCGGGRGRRQLFILPECSTSLRLRAWWDQRIALPPRFARREQLSPESSFEEMLERLELLRPAIIYSYGSVTERFFRFLEATATKAALPAVWVYGGDGMHREWREWAERRGCRVYSTYQAVEVGRIGFECERREGFHLNVDLCHVRILDREGNDVAAGEPGEVVVSNLVNRATVLLNARIGDRAVLSPEPCPCGRSLPLLVSLEGRVWEMVQLGDGRELTTTSLQNIFAESLHFSVQHQIVYPGPGRVEWRVVPLPGADVETAVRRMEARAREMLGPETRFRVEIVGEIRATAGGKAPPMGVLPVS